MDYCKHLRGILIVACFLVAYGCADESKHAADVVQEPKDPKVAKLKLPEGFHAEHLYGPSENKEGSWVSMTFDDKGRMIASDQYGGLYRLKIPAVGDTVAKVTIEPLAIPKPLQAGGDTGLQIGYAHGLLYAFNSLYVMINHESDSAFSKGSGLYRLFDTDGDDQFDKIVLIKALEGEGEHGPHSIVMAPDKKSIFVIAGNFTRIPKMDRYRASPDGKIDNLLPQIKDPNGHDNTVNSHGGWIAHVDSSGKDWELVSAGFRNPFDLAFNDAGEMFTYDSDMEWDFGTPWYRPTRICHVTSGAEFGWRPGTEKWSPVFADGTPALLNIGQGSPTNFFYGGNSRFPEKYRKALYAFDWSFGIIYAIHLEPNGASYKATGEEFVSGSPLPLTDGVIGPDGALYFLTGGRRLESDLYRVYYGDNSGNNEALAPTPLTEEQKIRRKLEEYHTGPVAGAVDAAWPYLSNSDRFIQAAARVALEHQPTTQWKEKVWAEKNPVAITQSAIALARVGNEKDKNQLLKSLQTIDFTKLTEQQQIDVVRAFELLIARLGMPDAASKTAVNNYLTPHFPSKGGNELNRELVKMLTYLDAPGIVEKTMSLLADAKDDNSAGQESFTASSDLIMRNPQYGMDIAKMLSKTPPAQQTYYATALSNNLSGWTPELREKYFRWFYHAFEYKGGHSFVGFIDGARKKALAYAPKNQFALYNAMSGDSIVGLARNDLAKGAVRPKGPGRDWTVEEALAVANDSGGIVNRNFEQGKAMFSASLCISCHNMRGEGGTAGPDLTQLGGRFSYKDMLESIIEPDKTISDQYGSTVFYLKGGGSVLGRLISQDDAKYIISQNPFAPLTTKEVAKKDVARTRVSEVSPMLPGMINRLNKEELKDLLAYLKSGGNPQDPIFSSKK